MIVTAAAFVASGTAGYLVGGASGVAAVVVAWPAVVFVWRRLQARKTRALPRSPEQAHSSDCVDIEDVIDRLDDLARERGWDLRKRFEIARMASENRTTPFDELERRYDLGLGSALHKTRQDGEEGPNNAAS